MKAASHPTPAVPAITLRSHALIVGALLAWVSYLAIGIFPAVPLEGDEQGVITGVTAMAHHAKAYINGRYNFEIQPGSYAVLSGLTRVTGSDPATGFAILTALGSAAFAVVGIRLVSRLLAAPWPLVAAAFLICQEITASAYYLNTTALGAAFSLGAVSLALKPMTISRGALASLLLAFAGWIRIDCVLISPALVAITWHRTRRLDVTLRETVPVAIAAILAMIGLYLVAGVNPFSVADIYAVRGGKAGWMRTITMFPLVTSFLVGALAVVGVAFALVARRWSLLVITAAGSGLSFVVYGDSLASNKYLYLAVPFFVLLAVFGATEIRRISAGWTQAARIAVWLGAVTLLLPDTLLGVLTSEARFRRFQPRPQLTTLAAVPRAKRPVQLVIGPGEFLATADGFRLRTGAQFAPLAWLRAKLEMRAHLDELAQVLEEPGDITFYYSGWLPYQIAVRQLIAGGFAFASTEGAIPYPFNGRWVRDGRTVRLSALPYVDSVFFKSGDQAATSTGRATYFLGDQNPSLAITPLADGHRWVVVPGWEFGYITLHRRD